MTRTPPRTTAAPLDAARRAWLRRSGGLLAASLGAGSLGSLLLAARPSHAADYKALVCLFQYGGNDGLNTVPPLDAARYGQYAAVRRELALPQDVIRPLAGSTYGLHPALSRLVPVWDEGRLAPVFNVGPLVRPLTREQYLALTPGSVDIPANLFSHSDQEALWETATVHGLSPTGWGGRAAAVLGTRDPVVAIGANTRFGVEPVRPTLVVPHTAQPFNLQGYAADTSDWAPLIKYRAAIDFMHAQPQETALGNAYVARLRDGLDVSRRLAATVTALPGTPASPPEIDAAFAPLVAEGRLTTMLADQLYQVAKLIHLSAGSEGNRQIYFVRLEGFDTHANQVVGGQPTEGEHAVLLREMGDALAAFYQATKNLGLADAVTTFTQSDFGRTFRPNNSFGTDHAWGNHQLVMGGAVRGGTTYGRYPELVIGGMDDIGVQSWEMQGRWLPTLSVDQYAATLLSWFGADEAQLATVLPNLQRFRLRNIGFV